jgi:hypothetical protein
MARRVYGQNFSLLRRTVWLLRRGQTDGQTEYPNLIPDLIRIFIGRGKKKKERQVKYLFHICISNYR